MENQMSQESSVYPKEVLPNKSQKGFIISQLSLRILVSAFTLAAFLRAITSDQSISLGFGLAFEARYYYSSALRFKVVADVVVSALSLLSLAFVYGFTRPSWNTKNYFYTLLHDLVLLLLMTSGCAAGSAIGLVARHGEEKIGWLLICNNVTKFCDKMMLSILFSYLALFCLLILTILAAYKLKS